MCLCAFRLERLNFVMTYVVSGGMWNSTHSLIIYVKFLHDAACQKLSKSAHVSRSYSKNKSGTFFYWDTVYKVQKSWNVCLVIFDCCKPVLAAVDSPEWPIHRLNGSSSPVLTATFFLWESQKFDPPQNQNPWLNWDKIWHGWLHCLGDHSYKISCKSAYEGGFSANRWNIRINFYSSVLFFSNSSTG